MGEMRTESSGVLSGGNPVIDPELLAILACPLEEERPPLRLDGQQLVCDSCHHAFPVVDGIPHLLPENAIAL